MATRMLIDATHAEETRVVVVKGTRLEEFDFETSTKKQLKGNIYLAKVTRVEPSLQAAFVEYGGNRHGFLAFSEIHPDYYQIPVADREALIEQTKAAERAAVEEEEADVERPRGRRGRGRRSKKDDEGQAGNAETASDADQSGQSDAEHGADDGTEDANGETHAVESVGGDELDDVRQKRAVHRARDYKIQEVIKRRQILLVQVVKEERGTKGAALTTYMSLAGRYCVLMPNTARGGGISRKIVNLTDRKRLKEIVSSFEVPEGTGVIVRTAGLSRTKAEIKRDYDYLLRAWDEIRETTLKSIAPCLVYEEASLIKRSIRDLYDKDIDEILVEGEEGYKTAKSFMRMLIPSHAKKVQAYREPLPLFQRYQVEQQFASMYSPTVTLRSGGYIVINPTEALVSIDVNSGKATREHSIEDTAYKTNLEAADEVARQLRLRDLAGLIVIDFIDMEENRNNRNVERRIKDALKSDRARIQVGRISAFGLLEMSRQRMRPSLLEASTEPCPHCQGTGYIRSTESTALHILRAIEEEGVRDRTSALTVHVDTDTAIYLLNQKRDTLQAIEGRYGMRAFVYADPSLIPPDHRLDRTVAKPEEERGKTAVALAPPPEEDEDDDEPEIEVAETPSADSDGEAAPSKRRRRRRRRKPGDGEGHAQQGHEASEQSDDEEGDSDGGAASRPAAADGEQPEGQPKRRRRGRRGGRRRRSGDESSTETSTAVQGDEGNRDTTSGEQPQDGDTPAVMPGEGEQPDVGIVSGAASADIDAARPAAEETPDMPQAAEPAEPVAAEVAEAPAAETVEAAVETAPEKPKRRRRSPRAKKVEETPAEIGAETVAETETASTTEPVAASPAPETVSSEQPAIEQAAAGTEDAPVEEPPVETAAVRDEAMAHDIAETERVETLPEPANEQVADSADEPTPETVDAGNGEDEKAEGKRRIRLGWWRRRD
ncbi:Rne/Rng family ribonuclease [Oceanibacterium hippocampi]|uniref:Ribonuclease E n=1 Tax=Oceanibacterium hippocampi TaxID=745714 RepID=A0A1Y5SXC3_9PROT|nr:ribonuclease E/G [Oceanibacterium hippocampi]SLN49012.1 Ribonuclease E [Oceanibacterium hippocampi]